MKMNDMFTQHFNNDYNIIKFNETSFEPKMKYFSEKIIIKKGSHSYGDIAYDKLFVYMTENSLRNLGLLILALLFSNEMSEICIIIDNKHSEISKIKLRFDHNKPYFDDINFCMQPDFYSFNVHEYEKHPFEELNDHYNNPGFYLTNDTEIVKCASEMKSRDVLVISGTIKALILLSDLFLNASHPDNLQNRDEYVFEAGYGYNKGICPGSIELSLLIRNRDYFGVFDK